MSLSIRRVPTGYIVLASIWALLLYFPVIYTWILSAREGGLFTGSIWGMHDRNLYLGAAQVGMQGKIFSNTLLFTTEEGLSDAFAFLPHGLLLYRIIGWIYGMTGAPVNLFFLLVGLPLSIVAFGAYYALFSEVFKREAERRLGMLLLFTFPGFIWLEKIYHNIPSIENWVPVHLLYTELWGIASMNPITHNAHVPHFVAASISMAMGMRALAQSVRTRQPRYFHLATFGFVVAWLLPALGILWAVVFLVFLGYVVCVWKYPLKWVLGIMFSLVPAACMVALPVAASFRDHVWAEYVRMAIAVTGVVDPVVWFMHLGALGVLGLWGASQVIRSSGPNESGRVLMSIWLLMTLLFSLSFQVGTSRLMDGFYLPAIALSVPLIVNPTISRYRQHILRSVIALALLPGTLITYIYPWAGEFHVALVDHRLSLRDADLWPIVLSEDESAVLGIASSEVQAGDTVIAGPVLAGLVPGLIGRQVYLGHIVRTLQFSKKLDVIQRLDQQPTLPGFSNAGSVWIIDTPKEQMIRPQSLRLSSGRLLCLDQETEIGKVTLSHYLKCG